MFNVPFTLQWILKPVSSRLLSKVAFLLPTPFKRLKRLVSWDRSWMSFHWISFYFLPKVDWSITQDSSSQKRRTRGGQKFMPANFPVEHQYVHNKLEKVDIANSFADQCTLYKLFIAILSHFIDPFLKTSVKVVFLFPLLSCVAFFQQSHFVPPSFHCYVSNDRCLICSSLNLTRIPLFAY